MIDIDTNSGTPKGNGLSSAYEFAMISIEYFT